jgi:hypothetical protein
MSLDWLWPVMTLVSVGLVAWLISRELMQSGRGRVERSFVCPVNGAQVTATFASDLFDSYAFADVVTCSRYPDGPVSCDKECLALSKLALARQDAMQRAAVH